LKDVLTNEFRDRIKVVEKMDRGTTGNFEVTIVETGKLIHTKKGGQGFADTAGKQQAIVSQIMSALKSL